MPLVILYARERLCWALRVLLARDVWQRITELHVCASMQCQIICYATHHWCWGCLQRWKLDTTIRPHFDHTLISESKCWPKWISLILCATLFRTYTGNPQQCGLAGACLSTRERERLLSHTSLLLIRIILLIEVGSFWCDCHIGRGWGGC